MKKVLFALAGAAIFSIASASAPVSAMPAQGAFAGALNNIKQVQWGHPGWHGPRRCWNERVVRRDRWGRRFVTVRRVCR